MLASASDAYASSISGYVISALLALLTALYLGDRSNARKEAAKQNESLSALNQSTAVLLAAIPVTDARLTGLELAVKPLEITTAVLKNELERHESWHSQKEAH